MTYGGFLFLGGVLQKMDGPGSQGLLWRGLNGFQHKASEHAKVGKPKPGSLEATRLWVTIDVYSWDGLQNLVCSR